MTTDPEVDGRDHRGMFDLSGRTALVTGASRGIGARAATTLDRAGARVVLAARDRGRLEELAKTLHHDPRVVDVDLAHPDGPEELLANLPADIDLLVNNAATHTPGLVSDVRMSDWDLVQNLNVRATFALIKGLAPGMRARGYGKIVNIASILGVVGDAGAAPYVSSKAAIIGMTRAVAVELAPEGIGVNALCPGWIETDMVGPLKQMPGFDKRVTRRVPLGRWGDVADLDGPLLFLCSAASDFVIGQTLVADGGLLSSW